MPAGRSWTYPEVRRMTALWNDPRLSVAEIAVQLGRSDFSVRSMARCVGLKGRRKMRAEIVCAIELEAQKKKAA